LILLFLFNIRYWLAELVDTKKNISFNNINLDNNDLEIINNNNILVINKINNSFGVENNQEFDSYKDYIFENNIIINRIKENIK
jgi:hypothetical protein